MFSRASSSGFFAILVGDYRGHETRSGHGVLTRGQLRVMYVRHLEEGVAMNNAVSYLDESAAGWERSLYAFLAEKERRSGSMRTVQSYSRMLQHFFGHAGKTPDQVNSQDVF